MAERSMRKYGSPEHITRVPDEAEPEADPQGINVTATRQATASDPFSASEIINEGEDTVRE
jgi:hypothetical protein